MDNASSRRKARLRKAAGGIPAMIDIFSAASRDIYPKVSWVLCRIMIRLPGFCLHSIIKEVNSSGKSMSPWITLSAAMYTPIYSDITYLGN
jgi:hypothetical protein